jgi:AAA15 family ATPase/GTPase
MIEKIKIENFRCFESLEVEGFKQFNILVGKNNGGKTSLLEALFGSKLPELIVYTNTLRHIPLIPEEFAKTLFFNFSSVQTAKINDIKFKIDRALNPARGEDDIFISFEQESNNFSIKFAHTDKGIDLQPIGKVKHEPQIRFIPTNIPAPIASSECMNLHKENQLEDIIQTLTRIDTQIKDIAIYGTDLYFKLESGRRVPLGTSGDGIRRIFSLLIQLKTCADGILFIDEIDMGLHHTSMKHLWNAVFDLATKLNVQVFCTTHSIDCLKAAAEVYPELFKNNEDTLRVFNVDKDRDPKVLSMDIKSLQNMTSKDWELR